MEQKEHSLFYNQIEPNEYNHTIIEQIRNFSKNNPNEQIYLVTALLGEKKYRYSYEEKSVIFLSPKHKIIFFNLDNNTNKDFEEYVEEFIEDLGSISDKYDYKQFIGRPKKWKNELIETINFDEKISFETLVNDYKIEDKNLRRKNELIISLITGSINDIKNISIEEPETILEKIKNKIILFDGEQTRFIYKNLDKKIIHIQGLSGTGKTELLLHKLREIYINTENTRIFFTCHNIALANTLKQRIPDFFDFMKVEKQIEWNKRLWVDRAWGSASNKNSGLYSYICHYYDIPFLRWSKTTSYEDIFSLALEYINKIPENEFSYAFDYILIDERQDFPDVFFDLCEKITKKKVYVAGDIFQDIFETNIEQKVIDVDFILNRCYRTDPRTLMFAHAIGMGLFEDKKLNWLTDKEWKASGYILDRKNNREICLYREPIKRFEDLDIENYTSMSIQKLETYEQILHIIEKIIKENPTVKPDDIAIINLEDGKGIYDFFNKLEFLIMDRFGWGVNKAYESKEKLNNAIFLTNKNNVKGLEFPFVLCVGSKIKDSYKYRNTLYTMLTRSFLKSYLLYIEDYKIEEQKKGLEIIEKEKCIKTIEPTPQEKEEIKRTIIKLKEERNISFEDFLTEIFNELKIDIHCRKAIIKVLPEKLKGAFEKELIRKFIIQNKEFYC
jgi:superfamily I DNA and RNA helicase